MAHSMLAVIPEARIPHALSRAVRAACAGSGPAAFRHWVRPRNVTQTSQLTRACFNIAETSTTAIPARATTVTIAILARGPGIGRMVANR